MLVGIQRGCWSYSLVAALATTCTNRTEVVWNPGGELLLCTMCTINLLEWAGELQLGC